VAPGSREVIVDHVCTTSQQVGLHVSNLIDGHIERAYYGDSDPQCFARPKTSRGDQLQTDVSLGVGSPNCIRAITRAAAAEVCDLQHHLSSVC